MPTRTAYRREVSEVFGYPPPPSSPEIMRVWRDYECPFIEVRCPKPSQHRDFDPSIPFGACSVWHHGMGTDEPHPYVICPVRFVQDRRIFLDTDRLLMKKPNTETIVVAEASLPIGRIDYILSQYDTVRGRVVDFVVLEVMACSTTMTGHVLRSFHDKLQGRYTTAHLKYGINFRQVLSRMMVQVIAKAYACNKWNKRMVWAIQDVLLRYMQTTTKVELWRIPLDALDGDLSSLPPILFFVYSMVMNREKGQYQLKLAEVYGATKESFSRILEPRTIPETATLVNLLERKIQNGESAFKLSTPMSQSLGKVATEIVSEPPDKNDAGENN